jgi:hypothetical protein
MMNENTLVEPGLSATINAPVEPVDQSPWCFSLPRCESHFGFPANCSAGSIATHGGRRKFFDVEILGGSLMVPEECDESISSCREGRESWPH